MAPEVKSPPVCAKGVGDSGLLPGSGGLPWRPTWPPAPRLLPGRSHGQRSLVGYSPGSKASDTAERLSPHTGLLTSWLSHCISPVVMASGGITGLYRTNQVGRITRDGGGTLVVQGGEPCWRSKWRTPRWGRSSPQRRSLGSHEDWGGGSHEDWGLTRLASWCSQPGRAPGGSCRPQSGTRGCPQ